MDPEATKNNTQRNSKKSQLYLAAIAANISSIACGTCLSWTSPVVPKLLSESTTDETLISPLNVLVTANDIGWIGSIISIGAFIAPFMAATLTDHIGRKKVLLSSAALFILGYLVVLSAYTLPMLLLGRFIKGLGIGIVVLTMPMYIGEIATDDVRGSLGSLMIFFMSVGMLLVLSVGPYVSYHMLQYFCLVVPIVFVVVFAFMPESPHFLVAKGQREKALQALKFLRGQNASEVEVELTEIECMIKSSMSNQRSNIIDIFKQRGNRKALLICLGLIIFQQLSGINALLFNTQGILASANMNFDAALAAICVGVLQLFSSGLTPFIADKFRRKTILLFSASFMCIGLAVLGGFFYVKERMEIDMKMNWIPLLALLLFFFMFTTGFGPMPWAILSEMFPHNAKSMASTLVVSTCWLVGFFEPLFYPILSEFGAFYPFWIFSGFCILAFGFVLFVVIETKGYSLQEIQDRLNKDTLVKN